jgi:hypothetical protein
MVIFQAIFSLLSKLAGKVLNAIFGWAVVALFGRSSPKQQTLLTGLVGAAAAWPLLLVGIALPKVAALVIAFVPYSKHIPALVLRLVWVALAIGVPVAVGLVVASKAPPGSPREPFPKRVARGFPITVGIAGAFALMFVIVPVLRLLSMARGRQDEHVPMLTTGAGYQRVAVLIDVILQRHQLKARRTPPAWWLMAPARILGFFGGRALRGFMPEELAYWLGPGLELALYPSDLLIRGAKAKAAWAHGVLAEGLTRGPGLQTLDVNAQKLEQEIRSVWSAAESQPRRPDDSGLRDRYVVIAAELGKISVPYDDWQVLYRETVQLGRTLGGEPQLLELATLNGHSPQRARPAATATERSVPLDRAVRDTP